VQFPGCYGPPNDDGKPDGDPDNDPADYTADQPVGQPGHDHRDHRVAHGHHDQPAGRDDGDKPVR
jgi:hypothetical protein